MQRKQQYKPLMCTTHALMNLIMTLSSPLLTLDSTTDFASIATPKTLLFQCRSHNETLHRRPIRRLEGVTMGRPARPGHEQFSHKGATEHPSGNGGGRRIQQEGVRIVATNVCPHPTATHA